MFVSPSPPLAVITRAKVKKPTSMGVLSPSTDDYVDAGQWKSIVRVTTGMLRHVADGLLDGQYDSALIYACYADKYPERLRLGTHPGWPDDAWLMLGRERTFSGLVQACADGPIARQLERRRLGAAAA